MNRGPASGGEDDNETVTVEGRTGEIRYEARCLRETDAEENSIRENDTGERYAGPGGSRLEARPACGQPGDDGPGATKTTVSWTRPLEF